MDKEIMPKASFITKDGKQYQITDKDAARQAALEAEILERETQDATTLEQAKLYADQIKEAILGSDDLNTTYDTLKEIQEWIEDTGSDVTDLMTSITAETEAREQADTEIRANIAQINNALSEEIQNREQAVAAINLELKTLDEALTEEARVRAEETTALQDNKADGVIIEDNKLYLMSQGNKLPGEGIPITTDLTEVYEAIAQKADGVIIENNKLYLTSQGNKLPAPGVQITTDLTEVYEAIEDKADALKLIDNNKLQLMSGTEALGDPIKLPTGVSDLGTNGESIWLVSDEGKKLGEGVFYPAQVDDLITEVDEENQVTKLFLTKDGEAIGTGVILPSGGGGQPTGSSLKIGYITTSPLVVTTKDDVIIKYTFSGTDAAGDVVTEGTATWTVAGRVVATNTAISGENEFDLTEYISTGSQKVSLTIVDESGSAAKKTWTVQKIDVKIETSFNDKITYPIGTIPFDYTPYGAIEKTIHFILDGTEINTVATTSSGRVMSYTLPVQAHGSHLLDVYITATISGNDIESNHILKDIMWYDGVSSPVISTIYQDFEARQYDTTNIEYTVYDPTTETPTVEIAVDGKVVSTPTLTKPTNIYTFKSDVIGEHIITITCGDVVKTLTANIIDLGIDIEPVTAGLVFDFNPAGKSNNDPDRLWSNGTVSMAVSENFDWINGGYQYDANGDQYFCILAGTSATIDYQLFADDARKNGKEMKLVFKTINVAKPDAVFLHCMDNTTDTNHIGIEMGIHEAHIYGQAGKLDLAYSEEDTIEFEFNISKNTEAIPMVMGYEDGVSTRPMVYDDAYSFTQNTPKVITLGSTDCDLHIYRFKVYNTSLNDVGILNNFIADARNAEEMIARYDRNQIYDENSNLNPDILAAKCPWLRVYKLSAPYFTNNKSDKVPNTTIQQIYKNGDVTLDNWTAYNVMHSGQGTSSNNYGAAGRNLDFIMNKSGIEGVEPYFKLGDGTETDKITLTRSSVPVAYLNAKVNIASSNNMTNAMLAAKFNEFNPYKRPFIRDEGVDTSFIKDTMEFYNCVIFIQETDDDISTHREFADKDWHFYAIGNIGDSKKTDKTRLTDLNDKYECCVEIMDVELPLSDFPVDTMYNAMGYKEDETTHEREYIWAKDENLGILYEKINGEYVLTEDTTVDLTKTYYVDILEHDDFSEDFTYGWRYLYEGDDDEENAEVFDYCKQKWIELYRFITTSTDEEFKNGFEDYFVKDSALYYYLFTTRYCMVDNRAKNSFWHYGKTSEVDAEGNPIRKWDLNWGYDMDTSLGLNNYGKQVYRYGLEDTDVDDKGEEVFRESDSTFFCRVRDLFPSDLKTMYNTLESKNAWHAESFINKADEWQSQFPEELWRIDIERKYIRTYNGSFINGKGDAQFLTNMANGKMKYHRRQWERSQEKYMASKYQSSVASGDNAVFRCSVPTGTLAVAPNYRLKLTPYAYMYLNVKYGTQNPIQLRAEPNKVYEIPFDGAKTDIIDVYSASLIQDFGDLSTCYIATADTGKAEKVKRLIFGNSTAGYDNPNFTTLTTGANTLLEVLDITNVSGLTQTLNLSALYNLKEVYARGSNVGGVIFADGGKIETAYLPGISSLNMKNLIYLTTLDISNYNNLTTLVSEKCNTINLPALLNLAINLNRVRITGINWVLENTDLLDRLYTMKGIDQNGFNTENPDQSVVTGTVHVPVLNTSKQDAYNQVWSELTITYDTFLEEYLISFVNYDNTILDKQWVTRGGVGVDPLTREENPIPTPTKPQTVDTVYEFSGWDSDAYLKPVLGSIIITALYAANDRYYNLKWYVNNELVQEDEVLYGQGAEYRGELPTKPDNPTNAIYYLFAGWDKNPYRVYEDNTVVHAVFVEGKVPQAPAVDDKPNISEYDIGTINAICKAGQAVWNNGQSGESVFEQQYFDLGDTLEITGGWEPDDVETNKHLIYDLATSKSILHYNTATDDVGTEVEGVTLPITFNQEAEDPKYLDTGIQLMYNDNKPFGEGDDYEFTFVLDFAANDSIIANGNTPNNPHLLDVYKDNYGFKMYRTLNTNNVMMHYNTFETTAADTTQVAAYSHLVIDPETKESEQIDTSIPISQLERIIVRKKKNQQKICMYRSNPTANAPVIWESETATYDFVPHNYSLLLGAARSSFGTVGTSMLANCTIYNFKVWNIALSDLEMEKMASAPQETYILRVEAFPRNVYGDGGLANYLISADNVNRVYPGVSLGMINLMRNERAIDTSTPSSNANGWDGSETRAWLANRIFKSLPQLWQSAIKTVDVNSSVKQDSNTLIKTSKDQLFLWSIEEYSALNTYPYNNEGQQLSLYTNNLSRLKPMTVGHRQYYVRYWTRSRKVDTDTDFYTITSYGWASYSGANYYTRQLISFGLCI